VSCELLPRIVKESGVVHKLRSCVLIDLRLRGHKADSCLAGSCLGIEGGTQDEDRGRIVRKFINDDTGGGG
jgi:hypothetical protein